MMNKKIPTSAEKGRKRLLAEIDELRAQLGELQQTINAIKNGEVDALVIDDEGKPNVYTLEDSDFPYRGIVETMAAGAVTINGDYTVLYSNSYFVSMLGVQMERVIGSSFLNLVPLEYRETFLNFVERSQAQKFYQELPLQTASGKDIYVHLAGAPDLRHRHHTCIIIMDISARKTAEEALGALHNELEQRVESGRKNCTKARNDSAVLRIRITRRHILGHGRG